MKKILCLLLIALGITAASFAYYLLLTYSPSFAQEEDVTPTPTKSKKIEVTKTPTPKSKVDEIKEKIASAVAQLNLVSKRGFVGEITKLEKSQLAIEKQEEVRIIDIDELTKYVEVGKDGKRAEIKFSELDVTDTIVAIGLYNKESRRLLARVILVKELPININGIVREVDIKGGTITVEDKKRSITFTIDIEKATAIRNYTKAEGVVKSGLSKIEIGQRAHVNGVEDKEEKNRIIAARVLLLPGRAVGITEGKGASPSAQNETPTPTPIDEATP